MKTYFQPRVIVRVLALALFTAGMVAAPLTAKAQTFKVLYSFTGGADGGLPQGGLLLDAAGDLYGTTTEGGDGGCPGGTCGVVFEVSPSSGGWTESVLHAFTGGSDGGDPFDTVIFDAEGNLYGTAYYGGAGYGVVFELSPGSGGWTETVLHAFQDNWQGNFPVAGLVFDKQGNLYSTLLGGSRGTGLVYELVKGTGGWKEKVLSTFSPSQGDNPQDAPILDAAGNLYGTNSGGGEGACTGGCGTVWKVLHGSWKVNVLYDFKGPGRADPRYSLVFDKAGNLYGTAGGGIYGWGMIFKLTPVAKGKWKKTVLYSFKGGSDGWGPGGTPVFDKAGNIYGVTTLGGDLSCGRNGDGSGCGSVFKLTPGSGGWTKSTLYTFTGGADGSYPSTGLIIDTTGNIYGMTSAGGQGSCELEEGVYGCGVVFEVTP